MSALTFNI